MSHHKCEEQIFDEARGTLQVFPVSFLQIISLSVGTRLIGSLQGKIGMIHEYCDTSSNEYSETKKGRATIYGLYTQ